MSDSTREEKFASALYLITSFFADGEPMKWRIRELSISLVSGQIKDKSPITKELGSLLTIGKNTQLISDANYALLIQELSKIEEGREIALDTKFFRESVEISLPQLQRTEYIKDIERGRNVDNSRDKNLKSFGAVSVKKNSRQSTIISILKRKKEIMIKDVAPLISGCSEKTIQRELSSMVESGVLKKVGEKRWSRYSLT